MRVLMVCSGNICRSPTAQGVLDKMIMDIRLDGQLEVDSAGTGNFHLSESPDKRAIKAALSRGYDLSRQRARQINPSDYESFDLILAMDKSNLSDPRERCPPHFRQKLGLFLSRSKSGLDEVPDPYSSGSLGFELVLDLAEEVCGALIDEFID
ncbi:MAG: low molecular weight protein-tyrosine-phosphatase [Pseudomonadota bacterium]|nr:low molecular weight protein-tyrosine-phosphatase [Pseudomonadota bacterium]